MAYYQIISNLSDGSHRYNTPCGTDFDNAVKTYTALSNLNDDAQLMLQRSNSANGPWETIAKTFKTK